MYPIFFLVGRTPLDTGANVLCLVMAKEAEDLRQTLIQSSGFCWMSYKADLPFPAAELHPDDLRDGCDSAVAQYLTHEAECHPFQEQDTPLEHINALLDGVEKAKPASGAGADLIGMIQAGIAGKILRQSAKRKNRGLRVYNPGRN